MLGLFRRPGLISSNWSSLERESYLKDGTDDVVHEWGPPKPYSCQRWCRWKMQYTHMSSLRTEHIARNRRRKRCHVKRCHVADVEIPVSMCKLLLNIKTYNATVLRGLSEGLLGANEHQTTHKTDSAIPPIAMRYLMTQLPSS